MKASKSFNDLFQNDKFVFIVSAVVAIVIWLAVVVVAGPKTTRVLKDVDVVIDETGLSQFGLRVFGESDFSVDVTVKGKKYQISTSKLNTDDIVVSAITTNVDSAGYYTLQLKAEPANPDTSFTVVDFSPKTIKVYFDTEKTVDFIVEPDIVTGNFPIAKKGFTYGDIIISEPTVSVKGPSVQVDKIAKVVARLSLTESLTSNKSEETEIIALDKAGKVVEDYVVLSTEKAVVKIPILRTKKVNSVVTFKNIPTNLVSNPLKYKISPSKANFNILVDDYEKATEYSVGVIDFRMLSPSNNKFKFNVKDTAAANPKFDNFVVEVDMSDYSQEYITVHSKNIKLNNPENLDVRVSGLDKSVVVVGKENDLKQITEDMISVDVDLSLVEIEPGQTITVPAVVTVNNGNCWAYGIYKVQVKR